MLSSHDLKKIQKVFSHFDCSEREVEIYIECLRKGPSSIQAIAKALHENRITVHAAAERLIVKGFLFETINGKRRKITAEEPDVLFRLLREKKQELFDLENNLSRITTLLEAVQSTNQAIPTVSLFEGPEGFQRILEYSLKAKNEFMGFTNVELFGELLPQNFLETYFQRRAEQGITSRLIFPDCKLARTIHRNAPLFRTTVRILPTPDLWQAGILSWNNIIAVKSFSLGTLSCTLIENDAVANFYREVIFPAAWHSARPYTEKGETDRA